MVRRLIVDLIHRSGLHRRRRIYRALLYRQFDHAYYAARYAVEGSRAHLFDHYLRSVRESQTSPNPRFDEQWYRQNYRDVDMLIERGEYFCGYLHYLVYGYRKGRLPAFDEREVLNRAFGGLINPERFAATDALQRRLAPPSISRSDGVRRLFVVVPTLRPELVYGGFWAFHNFLGAIHRYLAGSSIRIAFVTDSDESGERDRLAAQDSPIYQLLRTAEFFHRKSNIPLGSRDRLIAYSAWDLLFASELAGRTDEARVLSFVQEYEPAFHSHSSAHAILDAAFKLPSYPVFNSLFLKDYFRRHRLGIFSQLADRLEWSDFAWFNHSIVSATPPTQAVLRERKQRTLAVYARPESHAARNLYEIIELALRRLAAEGRLPSDWNILGIGSLSKLPDRKLGSGRRMRLLPKMTHQEYRNFLPTVDVGVSLMYAPHPSVVPFEFAAAGAIVVTNSFEQRDADFWKAVSPNILVSEPTVSSLASAIEEALVRSQDIPLRVGGAYSPPTQGWESVFTAEFIQRTLGRLL